MNRFTIQTACPMRSLGALFATLLSGLVAGCPLAEVNLDGVELTCQNDSQCPNGFTCAENISLCVQTGGDNTPASLVEPSLSRSAAGQNVPVELDFGIALAAGRTLLHGPFVRLDGVETETFLSQVVADGGPLSQDGRYHFVYRPTGEEAPGPHAVLVSFVDDQGAEVTGAAAGTLLLDFIAPDISNLAADNLLLSANESMSATLITTEPLVRLPVVSMVNPTSSVLLDIVRSGESDTRFSIGWQPSPTASTDPYSLLVEMTDLAGNVAQIDPGAVMLYDPTPPQIESLPNSIEILSAQGQYTRDAGAGATVTVRFLLRDTDAGTTVQVSAQGGRIAFTPSGEQGGVLRTFEAQIGPSAMEGLATVAITATDAAGNAATTELEPFTIDRSPPSVPDMIAEGPTGRGLVRLRREPFGHEVTDSVSGGVTFERAPRNTLEIGQHDENDLPLASGAQPGLVIQAYVPFADVEEPIAQGVVDDSGTLSLNLPPADLPYLLIRSVDGAGNYSPRCLVQYGEWLGIPSRKNGSGMALSGLRNFDETLVLHAERSMTGDPKVLADDDKVAITFGGGHFVKRGLPNQPSARENAAAVYDPVRGVGLLFGGRVDPAESCDDSGFYLCGQTWEWTGERFVAAQLNDPEGDGEPTARFGHAMVNDTARARAVLFGGQDDSGDCDGSGSSLCQATWVEDGQSWRRIEPVDGVMPPVRKAAAMAYDSARDQVVLFGGLGEATGCEGGQICGDTWWFNSDKWEALATDATHPVERFDAAMAYDPVLDETVLFGGRTLGGAALPNESWVWDGDHWESVVGDVPSPRFGHSMVFDPGRGAVILFGGQQESGNCGSSTNEVCHDLWVFDGVDWTLIDDNANGVPSLHHANLIAGSAIDGPTVLFGADQLSGPGVCGNGQASSDDGTCRSAAAWTYATNDDGAQQWEQRGPLDGEGDGDPRARVASGAVYEPETGRTILGGGEQNDCVSPPCQDSWSFKDGNWHRLGDLALPAGPLVRWPGGGVAALGQLDFTSGNAPKRLNGNSWNEIAPLPTGAKPSVRTHFAAVLVPKVSPTGSDRLVVFGGQVALGKNPGGPCPGGSRAFQDGSCVTGEGWSFDGTDWVLSASTLSAPAARTETALVYDENAQVVLLFGGRRCIDATGCDGDEGEYEYSNDTWLLSSDGWLEVGANALLKPQARAGHSLAWDASRHRVVLFGGQSAAGTDCGSGGRLCDDTWEWNGTRWILQLPADPKGDGNPSPRRRAALSQTDRTGRLLLFGGVGGHGETWTWVGGSHSRPAHLFSLDTSIIGGAFDELFPNRPTPPVTLRAVTAHWTAGGLSDVAGQETTPGARLLLWRDQQFVQVDSNQSSALSPSALSWNAQSTDELNHALGKTANPILHLAVEPLGTSGRGSRAALVSDAVRVEVRYLLKSSANPDLALTPICEP